jgi:hypothetical protein
MTAQSVVVPNNTYHIVIQDLNDTQLIQLWWASCCWKVLIFLFKQMVLEVQVLLLLIKRLFVLKTRVVTVQGLRQVLFILTKWKSTQILNNNNYTISQPELYQVAIQNPNGTQSSSCPFV